MSIKLLAGSCAVVALAAFALRAELASTASARASMPSASQPPRSEPHEPHAAAPAIAIRVAPVAAASDVATAEPPIDRDHVVDEALARDREHFAVIARDFAAESIDPVWSAQKSRELSESFAAAKLDTNRKLLRVECKRSRCELDIEGRHDKQAEPKLVAWLLDQSCAFAVEGDTLRDALRPHVQHVHLECSR